MAHRIKTIPDCVFLGEVLVEILQGPARQMCAPQAAGEEVSSRARHSAQSIALGWVKEMMKEAEHFETLRNSNDLTKSRATFLNSVRRASRSLPFARLRQQLWTLAS
jgi:hypothetical protein